MSEHPLPERGPPLAESEAQGSRKRPANPPSDARYPRKRSSKACHVCRARKTKCDNVRPTCGFCASISISCSYDDTERDHSSFDPASLEILRQLGQVLDSQGNLLEVVRSIAATQSSEAAASSLVPSSVPNIPTSGIAETLDWVDNHGIQQQADSPLTPRTASVSVAAARWFGLFRDELQERDVSPSVEWGFPGPLDGQDDNDMTQLQRATKLIDDQHLEKDLANEGSCEQDMWQASESISLLEREQILFENFIHRICLWLDLFDNARTFSTIVPRLAARNAGLLNAILALSGYHQSLDETIPQEERIGQNSALQYYYQTLHYVQKAMRYPTYQRSQELMATTLIISTYEMLRGSRQDWQRHLQGVFWILRSRQIEVEVSSLESTTWWAWLRQDIWAALRGRRRTYSTWTPKKACSDLNSYELASRAVWILAQVINFCAVGPSEETEGTFVGRIEWARALKEMLQEWESHLTIEFSELPAMTRYGSQVFKPRLIHPQSFGIFFIPAESFSVLIAILGLAMQIHYVSRILVCAHEPSLGGMEKFMHRQKTIQDSIELVCGIGLTLTEDASSMMSSQCLFIAGMFMQDDRQRVCLLEMLESCRDRCRWPASSLGLELEQIWASFEKA
ncbi:unnamed protein product [Clonostachys rhizophaga]|uniref:Zn(2)-C6 fungal-type domain-containing protein n=1 Tax=Clonostachys rhizophaga TaxID=160324 RepID=A0A9N9W4B0_9HYPO|nr:unnamed protein product [Clonostachys rhizophaga]